MNVSQQRDTDVLRIQLIPTTTQVADPGDLVTQSAAAKAVGTTPQAISKAIRRGAIAVYVSIDSPAKPHLPGARRVSLAEVLEAWGSPPLPSKSVSEGVKSVSVAVTDTDTGTERG